MLTQNFLPVEINGLKYDMGMLLLEFDTIRQESEPDISTYTGKYKDAGRFSGLVEKFIRERFEIVEVPTPRMLMPLGILAKDACITNYFEAADPSKLRYLIAETMAYKILGMPYKDIAPGYYRAGWLPPPQLKKGLRPVKFHYPRAGYFGVMAESLGTTPSLAKNRELETVVLEVAFVTGKPKINESVLFVSVPSPIYRVTNMEICAGIEPVQSRLVVEYRRVDYRIGCDIAAELARLNICHDAVVHGGRKINFPLPTARNLHLQPDLYCNSFNDQIVRGIIDAAR